MTWWLILIVNFLTVAKQAQIENTKWDDVKRPKKGKPLSMGGYAKGCIQGARQLPLRGRGFQAMRPSRNRRYGHPDLIAYIKGYGRRIKKRGLGTLLIGDLGQPMGGPSPFGHASHQSGLDVDIWFWRPDVANKRKLTMKERETMGAPSFVHRPTKTLNSYWTPKTARMLRLATQDSKVARIFVNPVIKRELCETEKNKDWLRKLRPWYGHRDHMHVRLKCPESSPDCVPQKELPKGNGCDGLDWWFRDVKKSERKEGKTKYTKKVRKPAVLPDMCYEMKSK